MVYKAWERGRKARVKLNQGVVARKERRKALIESKGKETGRKEKRFRVWESVVELRWRTFVQHQGERKADVTAKRITVDVEAGWIEKWKNSKKKKDQGRGDQGGTRVSAIHDGRGWPIGKGWERTRGLE